MMENLKPCPFCGGEAEINQIGNEHTKSRGFEVKCTAWGCATKKRAMVIRHTLDDARVFAITAWNTRPSPARDEGAGTMDGSGLVDLTRNWEEASKRAEAYANSSRASDFEAAEAEGRAAGLKMCAAELRALLAAPVSAPGMDREEGIRGPHEPAALGLNGPSSDAVNDGAPLDPEAWEVEVRLEGQSILTIGRTHLCGLSDIEPYGDVIRECADHLHAFIGKAPQPGHCALGDDGCVCFFDHEHCDNWRSGQEVTTSADGSQVEPSTTGAGRQIIPTDDQGGEGT